MNIIKNIMNYITNARSMNGIITLTNGVCEIEDGNITNEGNIHIYI